MKTEEEFVLRNSNKLWMGGGERAITEEGEDEDTWVQGQCAIRSQWHRSFQRGQGDQLYQTL